jgi:predicted metal-dependent phosphoesterase TrpH
MHKIDLHLHTNYSKDGGITEASMARAFNAGLLDTVAITDHDRIDGAQHFQNVFGDRIIVGEEINTLAGEIIGLFLKERIAPGLSLKDTVEAIKEQDGILYIPHPIETNRKGLKDVDMDSIIDDIEIIEVINGRGLFPKYRRMAQAYADAHPQIAQAASSDAHGRSGWGNVYTSIAEAPTRETLVELLGNATLLGSHNGGLSRLYPTINRSKKGLFPWLKR